MVRKVGSGPRATPSRRQYILTSRWSARPFPKLTHYRHDRPVDIQSYGFLSACRVRLAPRALRTKPAFGRGAGACALRCGPRGCRSLRGAPASSAARLRCRALRGSTLTSTDSAPPGSAYFSLQPGKRLLESGEPLLELTKKTLHLLQDIATGGGNAPTRRRPDAIHGAFDGRVDAACTTSCSGHVRWTSMLRRPLAASWLSMSMRAVPR